MPKFTMKDGLVTVQETITAVSIKNIDQVTEHKIEHKDGRVFHRISFSNGGFADVAWGGDGGEGFLCKLENVSQTLSQDPNLKNGVIITLHEYIE